MNRISIEPTIFIDSFGSKTYGYRMYDDYGKDYDNCMDNIPEDNLELLAYVVKNKSDITRDMFNHIKETQSGLEIAGTWYDFSEIKDIIS